MRLAGGGYARATDRVGEARRSPPTVERQTSRWLGHDSGGTLDPAFGSGGIVTTPIGPGEDIAYAVTVMPWGRIVAAGSARISTSAGGTDIAVVAYNANGTLDRFFANKGKYMAQVTGSPDEVINALVADVGRDHFWAIGAGVPTIARDFLIVDFGLPDTIFRDGFEVLP